MQQTLTQQSQGGVICHGGWDTHHHIFEREHDLSSKAIRT